MTRPHGWCSPPCPFRVGDWITPLYSPKVRAYQVTHIGNFSEPYTLVDGRKSGGWVIHYADGSWDYHVDLRLVSPDELAQLQLTQAGGL
jgi:hypothetical protein